jgi:hypothetical protein
VLRLGFATAALRSPMAGYKIAVSGYALSAAEGFWGLESLSDDS